MERYYQLAYCSTRRCQQLRFLSLERGAVLNYVVPYNLSFTQAVALQPLRNGMLELHCFVDALVDLWTGSITLD